MQPRAAHRATPPASELRLPAKRSELRVARRYAREVAAAFGLDADASYEFVSAVNEAVTNAIRHGASDEQGQIRLSVVADDDRLTFAVRDHGTFTMPVPVVDGAAKSVEHGRGLALMTSLVDEVRLRIEPGGTTVSLSKARP
jgi:serine/threonine-protein kinase RsbW